MKKNYLLVALIFAFTAVYSQRNFELKGFGKVAYTQNEDIYKVVIKDFGTFDFSGTIQPLNLESKVGIDQLKRVPGYQVLKQLELLEVELKLSSDGFKIEAKADTKKKLKPLCDALQIQVPYIVLEAEVTSNSFEMSGGLDFSENPIVINFNQQTGTRMILQKFTIGAEVEVDMGLDAVLYVKNEILFRPTKHDPDLKTVLALSFNLLTLELSGACSLDDTWYDPFGISHHIGTKKEDVSIGNIAVELGWVIGSPVPTTIGFAVGYAKLFEIQCGMLMSIAPVDGEIAFKAHSEKITFAQFENTIKKMNVKIPDNTFPNDPSFYIEDANILFAPTGGSVGEFEIEKGFAFRGGINFGGIMHGSVSFFANLESGFSLDMYMNAKEMYKILEAEIKKEKDPNTRKVLELALNSLRINEVHLHLSADNNTKTLAGAAKCDMVVFGKKVKFDLKGAFNPKDVIENIIKELGPIALKHVENIGKEVMKVAGEATNASIQIAKAGYDKLGYYSKHATTWKDHATHGNSCYTKCVPNRAAKLYTPVLESSNLAVKDFYNRVNPVLSQITSESERVKFIKPEWDRLINSIDNNWENIIKDDYYKGFDINQSDVEKLGVRYREIVRAKKQEHVKYRDDLWKELVSVKYFLFYEKGSAEIYIINNDGSIGVKVNQVDGTWRPKWSEIEHYRAGGRDRLLFYQQEGGGSAEMYFKGDNGSLAGRFASTNDWLGTWSDIEYYSASGQDMMLFYQQAGGGSAAMYKLKADGTLGDRIAHTDGWRSTWTDIEYYKAGDRDLMLFYQQADGGYAEMYEIKPDGNIGAMISSTKSWLATWTDIEYYRVGGKDYLMFYQQKDGTAVIYEVSSNGGLGRKAHEIKGWRNTWTEIEVF